MTVTIYHNPRCSKSRATLEMLQERGEEIDIVEYLQTPFTADQLRDLLAKLGLAPGEVIRKGEAVFKELGLGEAGVTDDQLIDAMAANPILVERPIVVNGGKAAIGRPIENVVKIL